MVTRVIVFVLLVSFIQGCAVITESPYLSSILGNDNFDYNKPVVMFILDTSGSMNEQDTNQARIEKAKSSIVSTVTQLDINRHQASLVTFNSHQACGVRLVVKPSDNLDNIVDFTKSVNAYGKTPLATAIRFSGNLLEKFDKKMIILLTDGMETCGGDPVKEAQRLHDKYKIDINFQIIGYAVDSDTRRKLEKISQIHETWNYYDAKNYISLNNVIDRIMDENNMRDASWVRSDLFIFEFDTDSIILKEEYLREIKKIYSFLKHNNKKIQIIGHTDSIGSSTYNLRLSKQRANIVRNKLIQLGIHKSRIFIDGKGEADPRGTNDTKQGRQLNRRVEISVLN